MKNLASILPMLDIHSETIFQRGSCCVSLLNFSIGNDWSFDDAINSEYGCEVHSFDPRYHFIL